MFNGGKMFYRKPICANKGNILWLCTSCTTTALIKNNSHQKQSFKPITDANKKQIPQIHNGN